MKQNFWISQFYPWQTRKDKKRNKRNFHWNTRTTISEYWVEETAKKGKLKQSSNKCTKQSWIDSGLLGFPLEITKAEPWKVLKVCEWGGKCFQHEFLGIFLEICFFLTLSLFILRRHCHKYDTTIHNQHVVQRNTRENEKQALCRRNFL